jgi:hypothetical protein
MADERTTALSFLRWHRATLLLKCSGLDVQQLTCRPVSTSALSLIGLVRHATESERFWFRVVMAGDEAPPLYSASGGDDQTFDVAGSDEARSFERSTRGAAKSSSVIVSSRRRQRSTSLATSQGRGRCPCAGFSPTYSRSMRATTATRTSSESRSTVPSGSRTKAVRLRAV